MWLLTAYILAKLAGNGEIVSKSDLIDFIFNKLWKEGKIALNDSVEELNNELNFLERLGLVEVGEEIRVKEDLRRIAKEVENDPLRYRVSLWDEYIRSIDSITSMLRRN